MSRPSFLRIGGTAVNVDRILWIDEIDGRFCRAFVGFDDEDHIDLPGLTLDQFEEILRDSGREVATVDGAA